MSYATIEAAAAVLVRALSRFSDEDVTRGDFRVLDRGSPPYVVLLPGEFETVRDGDWAQVGIVWMMYAEVYEKFLDDDTVYVNLEATRQEVLEVFNANPTMGGVANVTLVLAERAERPLPVFDDAGGGPHFLMQSIAVRIVEETSEDGSGQFV